MVLASEAPDVDPEHLTPAVADHHTGTTVAWLVTRAVDPTLRYVGHSRSPNPIWGLL
jgi:hypothetical protein